MENVFVAVRVRDTHLAVGFLYGTPDDIVYTIDELCDPSACEFKVLEGSRGIFLGDATLPVKYNDDDERINEKWNDDLWKDVHLSGNLSSDMMDEDADDWISYKEFFSGKDFFETFYNIR